MGAVVITAMPTVAIVNKLLSRRFMGRLSRASAGSFILGSSGEFLALRFILEVFAFAIILAMDLITMG
jgi:hypothetical protein